MTGIGAYYELDVTCRGESDPITGFLMNISVVDEAVRLHAIPIIEDAVRHGPHREPGALLPTLVGALQPALGGNVRSLTWRLTPFYHVTMETSAMERVQLTQQFAFSAAHRLHCPDLTDDRNRAIFGKCNNANGHGHNYRVDVTVTVSLASSEPNGFTLRQLEQIVDERVIRQFDHTHLNLDRTEFADLNPSVEHIVKVCHDLLADPIATAGARLERVTVWETDKTCCTYPAP